MIDIAIRAPSRNFISPAIDLSPELPALRVMPATAGGTYLVRRHHIRPELADLIAAAIGLGAEQVLQ
jgi:hypothetical protein